MNDNVTGIGDRYFVHSSKRWTTNDGDGQGAIIKDRATNKSFIVLAEPEIWARVCDALNIADAALDRAGERPDA